MSQWIETNKRTFTAGAALAMYRRVKLSAGKLAYAGVADRELGQLEEESFADGDVKAVRLRTAFGTCKMVAAGAITAGATVYAAADGKIDDTVTTVPIGTALEAATANLDVIEVLRDDGAGVTGGVSGVAGGYKVARGQHTTVAASDTVVTGLATVVSVVASYETDPADANVWVSAQVGNQAGAPAAGSIIIKTWRHDGTDPTPLAANAFGKLVNWIAIGT